MALMATLGFILYWDLDRVLLSDLDGGLFIVDVTATVIPQGKRMKLRLKTPFLMPTTITANLILFPLISARSY